MQLTLILQLQIALFVAFLLLVICIIKIWLQRKALEQYRKSTELFKQSVNGYQESVELFRQAINEYEFLLKEHGIDTSKPKAKVPQQSISPPPLQFKVTQEEIDINNKYLHSELIALTNNVKTANQLLVKQRLYPGKSENWLLKQVISDLKLKKPQEQLRSKTLQTEVSLSPPSDTPLPDLKKIKRQPSKPKRVSKNNPLYKELLNLISGNEEIANRLITHQQQLNPDKLENWILEKVVGDIKRDRRV
ncbi:MAG: hypothetical protein V7K88_12055 [Nostoc sp.]|uniref:hypothetical protein n=1 Tax=Nostoc sp. TaxID=1180 RepID=UPI002FFB92B7